MARKFTPFPSDLVQTHPGLGILRLAALLAEGNDALDEDAPAEMWPELVRGLMASSPAKMIQALRQCGALQEVLPEVAALFGVPQIADDPAEVDLGDHLLNSLAEAAECDAPLAVRFSLLVMNVGKADSPREHLPVHYRHIERGRPRIEAICSRFEVPAVCRELALLALAEYERVHRVSEVRAGPVALMLGRAGAFDAPDLFRLLMMVCACDYRAYGDRSGQDYPKAALLDIALRACNAVDETGLADDLSSTDAVDAVQTARAVAIAQAFRSQRWSDEVT